MTPTAIMGLLTSLSLEAAKAFSATSLIPAIYASCFVGIVLGVIGAYMGKVFRPLKGAETWGTIAAAIIGTFVGYLFQSTMGALVGATIAAVTGGMTINILNKSVFCKGYKTRL